MVDITAQALQDFLERLGRCYRHPGRLYLVGGSSLILVAAKVSTLDIDLQFDIPGEYYDVFIFDFYSVALSKLHRGNEKDFADVVQMVGQDLIKLSQLREQFQEVLPQLELFDFRVDPEDFERNFSLFEELLAQS